MNKKRRLLEKLRKKKTPDLKKALAKNIDGFQRKGRLTYALLLLLLVLLCGAIGYVIIEGWKFTEALYMTVITIATVGYGEVKPLSEIGKLFTIGVIVMGVGTAGYSLSTLTQLLVSVQLAETFGRRRVEREIAKLKNHYLVCGYGRMGRIVCRELLARGRKVVVVEEDETLQPTMESDGVFYIIGDVTDEDVLQHAGIERARSLVAAVKTDADNLYLTLTARQLNPALYIVSRAAEENAEKKLLRAGANQVVSPYQIGGMRMAHAILRPAVVDFLDMTVRGEMPGLRMEGIQVMPGSSLAGKTLAEADIRKKLGLNIIAVKQLNGEIVTNPAASTKIELEDILITVGTGDAISKLEEILAPKRAEK